MSETAASPGIEFAEWRTPFENGNLTVLDVSYCSGAEEDTSVVLADGRRYCLGSTLRAVHDGKQLVVRLFNNDDETVYRVSFQYAGAFRLLDEHGLIELWHARKVQSVPLVSTFRVRNHAWSKESPISFHMCAAERWSYVVATDAECVEVLSRSEPEILREDKVTPVAGRPPQEG